MDWKVRINIPFDVYVKEYETEELAKGAATELLKRNVNRYEDDFDEDVVIDSPEFVSIESERDEG